VGSSMRALRKLGVEVVGRIRAAHDDRVMVDDERRLRPRTVVWATGFRFDFSGGEVPVLDERGVSVHERG
jgi:NADH dehydrogenase FAD-containing subunit